MFSSLEALDAEDNLNASPVVRQGVFQPKAKPRVRKGGAAPARTPTSAPPLKTKIVSEQSERDKINVPNLREEAKTVKAVGSFELSQQNLLSQSSLVGVNFDVPSVDVAPAVTQVGFETGPMQSTCLTGTSAISPIYNSNFTGSVRSLNIDVYAGCQETMAMAEPTRLERVAEVSRSPGKVTVSTQESVAHTSEIVSEPDANSPFSAFSQGHDLGCLAEENHAFTAFEELLTSCAFGSLQSCRQGDTLVEEEDSSLKRISDEFQSQVPRDVVVPSLLGLRSLVSEPVAPLEEIDRINASEFVAQGNDVLAAEDVAVVRVSSQRVVTGSEDPSSYPVTEIAGPLRKKKSSRKDREDNLLAMNQDNHVLNKEALVFERGANMQSKAKPLKRKKEGGSDDAMAANPTASISADEASVAEDSAQLVMKSAADEPVKRKTAGSKRAQKTGNDGQSSSIEASSKKAKKVTSASASQRGEGVSVEESRAEDNAEQPAKTLVTKQEAQSQVEELQDIGEAYTSAVSKRKRRKPAKLAADDDEENITYSSIKGSLEPAKKNRRRESQVDRQQEDTAESELLSDLFPTLPEKISKLKASKFSSFNATVNATTSQSPAKVGRKSKSKPTMATAEEGQKKTFKKCVQQRRRVDRRAMNPADPDLDPKKMKMKDIIRLAEAKERMLKKDNAKKAKNGNQQTTQNEPDREPESYESACLAPQVQIVDGKIVINEQSLVINAHPKDDIRTYKRVEETHAKLNYHSYMKRTPTQVWRPDETELFYQALREFGTNFSMMQHLFPGRTRKQVLLKYKKEERCSPLRISEAMRVKPCETSHFLEVMSSLNLLPSEIPHELESVEASIPLELSSSRKEMEDISGTFEFCERRMADGDDCAIKLDDSSMNSEKHDKSIESPCNTKAFTSGQPKGDEELHIVVPSEGNEVAKPCESPQKASSPPRKKKSLFSYQTTGAKS